MESNSLHVSGILKLKEVLTLKYSGLNMFDPSFIPQFYIGIRISDTLDSRGYFFLIGTDGSRRSRVNEAQSAEEKKITAAAFFLR